jgi:hypothetical protein
VAVENIELGEELVECCTGDVLCKFEIEGCVVVNIPKARDTTKMVSLRFSGGDPA